MTEYTTPLCKTGEGSQREQWPLMALGALLTAAAGIWLFVSALPSVAAVLLQLPLYIICAWGSISGFLELQQLLGEVRITAESLTVMLPFSPPETLQWADFQQVCICLYNRVALGEIGGQGHPQLVFVRPGAKKNLMDRWKTYDPFQHHNLIAIDYDEDILEAVRALCPMEIIDLRDTPPYK